MRLGAVIDNADVLHRIGSALGKLDKEWVLRFTPDKLDIMIVQPSVYSKVRVWSSVMIVYNTNQDTVFAEYQVESKYHNIIHLHVSGDHWQIALNSARNAVSVTMKLTKKGDIPVLNFIITSMSKGGKITNLIHNIPVRIYPPSLADNFAEPVLGLATAKVHMPPIRNVLQVLEKLKHIDHNLHLIATRNGYLRLRISTDDVYTSVDFNVTNDADVELVSVNIDVRDFIKALSCEAFNPTTMILGLFKTGVCSLVVGASVEQGTTQIATMNYHVPSKDQD